MAYFEDFKRTAIQPGYVEKEGDYQVFIKGIKNGTLQTGERYTQVECQVNYPPYPRISLFLTEGRNFDGNFTAFCDTFGINDYQNPNNWINKSGYIHIMIKKKDGFTNMVPRWILDNHGFVQQEVKAAANMHKTQQQQQQQERHQMPQQVQEVQKAYGGDLVVGPDGDTYGDIPF